MIFWILAAMLVVLALAIVLWPLIKKPTAAGNQRRQQNINIAREQLAELEAEYQVGSIDQDIYEQRRQELELALHESLATAAEATPEVRQKRPVFALLLTSVFVPVFSIGMYLMLGSPDMATGENARAQQAAANARAGKATQTDVNEMVATLRQKLEAKPDNLEGWVMLGRSYMVMQRFEDAVYSYDKARGLQPNDPNVLLPLADALAMNQGGQLAGKPQALVDQVLALEPENTMGLWLAGMAASQSGDDTKTVEYWTRLEKLLPPGSEDQVEVSRMLADLGAESSALVVAEVVTPAVVEGLSIDVQVSLSDSLREQASLDDVVFVYAKATSGPPMPLAVVRKKVSDLPIKVILDDSQAMMPQMKLSDFSTVTVGARISKTGQPVASPGDLYTEQSPVALGADIQLSIDTIKQ